MTDEEKRTLVFDFIASVFGLDDALIWAVASGRYADDEVSDERVLYLLDCFKGDNDEAK